MGSLTAYKTHITDGFDYHSFNSIWGAQHVWVENMYPNHTQAINTQWKQHMVYQTMAHKSEKSLRGYRCQSSYPETIEFVFDENQQSEEKK